MLNINREPLTLRASWMNQEPGHSPVIARQLTATRQSSPPIIGLRYLVDGKDNLWGPH